MNGRTEIYQCLAEEQYLKWLLKRDANTTEQVRIPRHVAVIVADKFAGNFVRIPESAVRCAKEGQRSYLYLIGVDIKSGTFVELGGLTLSRLEQKGTVIGEGRAANSTGLRYAKTNASMWEFHKSILAQDLYDNNAYITEQLPQAFMEIDTACSPARPLEIYLRKPSLEELNRKAREANYRGSTENLVMKRFRILDGVSKNSAEEITQSRKIANYTYIANEILLEDEFQNAPAGSGDFSDVDYMSDISMDGFEKEQLRTALEVLSHWLFDRYVMPFLSEDSGCREWIATQERQLLLFKLETEYTTEERILRVLDTNNIDTRENLILETNLDPEIAEECSVLHNDRFQQHPLPTAWFSAPVIECLEMGMQSLSGSSMVIRNGRCYMGYKHLQLDYLPNLLKHRILHREVSKPGTNPDEVKLYEFGNMVADEVKRMTRPRDAAYAIELPPIEDCANEKLFPPCQLLLSEKLRTKKHLKFHERYQLSSFLLDVGWKKEEVAEYFRRYFLRDGSTTDAIFNSKYMHIVKYNEQGKWEDEKRTQMYGRSCETLLDKNKLPCDPSNEIGCPFLFRPDSRLERMMEEAIQQAPDSIKEIMYIAKQDEVHKSACAHFFKAVNGSFPPPKIGFAEWRPRSPHGYFNAAFRKREQTNI